MKNSTLFLAAIVMASSAMAQGVTMSPRETKAPASKAINFQPKFDLSNATILTENPNKSRSESDVITNPSGTTFSYTTEYKGFKSSNGYCYPGSGMAINNIVYGSDGAVYFQDIVTSYSNGTYVRGEYDENWMLRVDFPQTVFYVDYGEGFVYEIQANLLKFTYTEGEYGVNIDYEIAEDNYVTYSVDWGTGEYILNLPEWNVPVNPQVDNLFEYAIGLTSPYQTVLEDGEVIDSFFWLGCADTNQTKTMFNKYPAYIPDGLNSEEWALIADNNYSLVNVAIDNDKNQMYIDGINEFDPAAAIVGTIADGKVTFEAPQYMGWCSNFSVPVYFCTGEFDETGYNFLDDTFNSAFVFNFDAENKVLTSENPAMCLIENAADTYAYPFRSFQNPTIKLQNIEDTYAVPADPSLLDFYLYDSEAGYGYIVWDIPSLNVNKALMPTDNMYYNLYVDGDLFPLTPWEYVMVAETMEDIPYNYTDGYDINVGGSTHWIFYYIDGVETMGVQSFYAADNGITYSSNRITYNLETGETTNEGGAGEEETSGIENVEETQIAAVYYTNLMGQRVANPESGLYIKTILYNNGTAKSAKVIVRK